MLLSRIKDIEEIAKSQLDKAIFDFIFGGAGDEITLERNALSYNCIELIPRVLTGISSVNSQFSFLGDNFSAPIIIAPTAFHKLLNVNGELATAAAAANKKCAMIVSTMSSMSLEDIAQSNNALLFQLYLFKDKQYNLELIQRIEAAGYKAIVLTVDMPIMAKRYRDIKNQLQFPHTTKGSQSSVRDFTNQQFKDDLSWQDVKWLRNHTNLPIFLKGILSPVDATIAVSHNVQGIIVSNHGGRQLDTAVSPLAVLPEITKAINKQVTVLVDGSICKGVDIVKALLLGADGVCIGRPPLWGLAVDGQKGVEKVLDILSSEFHEVMRLMGFSNLNEIRQAAHSNCLMRPNFFKQSKDRACHN